MGPLSLYLGHIHAYDCVQYIVHVYNCWDLFQASFTGVRESWRTSDGSPHHVNCKNPSWSRYCIFARFLFLLLTFFFFFRQLVSLKMLNTLPQVSISVTLSEEGRTIEIDIREPLVDLYVDLIHFFYPKNKNGNGFLILTVSYHERFPFWNFQKSKGEG